MKRETMLVFAVLYCSLFSYSQEFGSITDSRDNRTYKTVKIGDQVWMAENLNIGKMVIATEDFRSDTEILLSDKMPLQTDNDSIEKFCYKNDHANCEVYGGLYYWDEMMQYHPSDTGVTGTVQGICPNGWHIPTYKEFYILIDFLGGEDMAGGKLKEAGTGHWESPNIGATNESGFTALPGGHRISLGGIYKNINILAFFWTATEFSIPSSGRTPMMSSRFKAVSRDADGKFGGCSVRCVKDN